MIQLKCLPSPFILSLMCLCLFGCSEPETPEPVKAPTEPVLTAAPVEGESFFLSATLDMLWCKPGTFQMGSPEDEKNHGMRETQHEVTLTQGFWLGKYEVTQAQWLKVMGGHSGPNPNPSRFKGATLPLEYVSWNEVMKFCQKLTQNEKAAGRLPEGWAYTLPTEAQWEYACRAGTTTATAFGDSLSSKQANFDGNAPYGGASKGPLLKRTTEVGSYPANAWGFHDMHGNVSEWCHDWYGDCPSGSTSDPVGPSIDPRVARGGTWATKDASVTIPTYRRVYRGGSWGYHGHVMRSAGRSKYPPHYRRDNLGFRLSLQTEKTE